ncbi:Transcription factor GTE4 [Camellia lanceoleosa]|uniref:Transcription factor GTE4 n=1 Tax=Camellia lanceoleosa TaxID=1840588 RepID=A0ACC0I3C1_9ERIC|nr:Transcription factor GTE4 [Camellia lanceoleosa]
MTLSEKQQIQKPIQKLPPRNLDHVVEIIQHNKPSGKYSSDEIHVDLEKEDNVALWRLYYYVEAVENTRKLPG